MAIIAGYIRSAPSAHWTAEQQQEALRRFGLEDNFIVAETSRSLNRLNSLIEDLGAGDTIVVTSVDRIGLTLEHVLAQLVLLHEKGVALRTVDGSIDLNRDIPQAGILHALISARGRLQKERAGASARAKRAGVMTDEVVLKVEQMLAAQPPLAKSVIARAAGISRARLYQYLSERSAQIDLSVNDEDTHA